MFTFLIQLADLVMLHSLGLFLLFYICSWVLLLTKLYKSSKYRTINYSVAKSYGGVSIIIPVFNEPWEVLEQTLVRIKSSAEASKRKYEVIVVYNGFIPSDEQKQHTSSVADFVLFIEEANKRKAINHGLEVASYPHTILLDSDSWATSNTVDEILLPLDYDVKVGGVVSEQRVFNRDSSVWRKICDWFEDIRFNNTTKGLSVQGQIPCLIGRLFSIRTAALKSYMSGFLNETFMGEKCLIGDDRYLTNRLLQDGYKTVYTDKTVVYTDAPETLGKFAKQRLRWSRSSFRETLMSLGWMFKFPYMSFVLLGDILMRWFFFAIVVRFALFVFGYITSVHYIDSIMDTSFAFYAIGSVVGFLVSGYLKQLPHLRRYPRDFWLTPVMLLVIMFVLTPVEWYGNLTCKKNGWMTRKLEE